MINLVIRILVEIEYWCVQAWNSRVQWYCNYLVKNSVRHFSIDENVKWNVQQYLRTFSYILRIVGSDFFQKYFVTKIKSYYSCKLGSIHYKLWVKFLEQSINNIHINKLKVAICNEFTFKIYIFQTKATNTTLGIIFLMTIVCLI